MNFPAKENEREDLAETRPVRPVPSLGSFQQIRIPPRIGKNKRTLPLPIILVLIVILYFILPFRTNFLILGIDSGLGRGEFGRTDTIILTTISPLRPYVGLLSIPRDLWVVIPGVGENRINTAYFFAEVQKAGDGPGAALQTVEKNFNVPVKYFILLRMDGLLNFLDAIGGVDIDLAKPSAGYDAGHYHLNGQEALAFARSRAGSDDFSRMAQGQILLKGIARQFLEPGTWVRFPQLMSAANETIQTNIPVWLWPRLGLAFIRAGLGSIDSQVISRVMVHPFVTSQGAQVLAPDWDAIEKVVRPMFGIWYLPAW